MNKRSEALAARLEAGAEGLAAFVATVTETEWQTRVSKDGRKIGVVVHYVVGMYPAEMQLARMLAAGQPVTGVTWDGIDAINRDHAQENDAVAKEGALAFLASNSAAAEAAIRALSDEDLDRAAPVSLNSDAPLTSQSSSRIIRCGTATTISLGSERRLAVSRSRITCIWKHLSV